MSSDKTKNDVAWEILFNDHDILERINSQGYFEITSKMINAQREARLMTKFDHHIQLPQIFKENDLSIQPRTRGSYLIGNFESYYKFRNKDEENIIDCSLPDDITTIDYKDLYSESSILLCAYNAGIIDDLLGEEARLTVFGRMSAGAFSYSIKNKKTQQNFLIEVENSQLEIDSGFESDRYFAVLEAKNETVEDFLVRQIYYPYRLWKTKTHKEVLPIFLTYSNDVFSFFKFRFDRVDEYNSLELIEQRNYQIAERGIELEDIIKAVNEVRVLPEPDTHEIPFPQADDFNRVVDLLKNIHGAGVLLQEDVTTNYAFDKRQTQYYSNAGRYLDLFNRRRDRDLDGVVYFLTDEGNRIMNLSPKMRNLAIVKKVLEHKIFNETIKLFLRIGTLPELQDIVRIMANEGLGYSQKTLERRARTIRAWVYWIFRLTRQ